MQTAADTMSSRRILRSLPNDLVFALMLVVPIIVYETSVEPFRRGFFCNDESIRYPYRPNTITMPMLTMLGLVLPLLLIVLVEFMRWYVGSDYGRMLPLLAQWRAPSWLFECAQQCICYSIGFLVQLDVTEVAKYTAGRLRPHFMEACEPDLLDGTSCSDSNADGRYIEDYVCAASKFGANTASIQHEARISFPSGHSAIITYGMVYMSLYLHGRFRWQGTRLLRYVLQTAMLLTIWYVTLTRISDYWHHPTDVLAGALLGGVIAILTAVYKTKLFATRREHSGGVSVGYGGEQQQQQQYTLKLPLQQPPMNGDVLQRVMPTLTPYQ